MANMNSAPTGCYKCGRTGHWSHDCPDASKSDNPNLQRASSENPSSTATGCYKCGRPGHWARDCPDAPKSDQPNLNASSSGGGADFTPNQVPRPEKPKKVPRTRPKLTPELLLSDDGLGYILHHFPRAFRYRGRGHEVSDLGNLIGLYREWHKHLLPYYSFDQFVHKVDKVASSKRVKVPSRSTPMIFFVGSSDWRPPRNAPINHGLVGAQSRKSTQLVFHQHC